MHTQDRFVVALIVLALAALLGESWWMGSYKKTPPTFTTLASVEPTIFANGFDPTAPVGCPSTIAPDGVQRLRVLNSPVGYGAQQVTRANVSLTEWVNVYGYNNAQPGPPAPWPGVDGSAPTLKNFKTTSWAGLHFRTPDAPEHGFASNFKVPTAIGSPPITVAISTACGDFAQYLPSPACVAPNQPSGDQSILYYYFGAPTPTACALKPGTDYYLNLMFTDPSNHARCYGGGNNCPFALWR